MDLNKVKRFAVEQGMEGDNSVFVVVNRTATGVVLPSFLTSPVVALQFGYGGDTPIPDLWVDDEGIVGTLAFKEGSSLVKVPWASVCIVHDGDPANSIAFPLHEQIKTTPEPPKPGRHLALVPLGKEAA